MHLKRFAALMLIATVAAHAADTSAAAAPPGMHWVGTWGTASYAQTTKDGTLPGMTLRQIVHVSLGGAKVRVVFSNAFGTEPLTLSAAGVAVALGNTTSAIQPASAVALTFGGHAGMVIPAGAIAVSDAVTFKLAPLSDLAITAVLPAQTLHVVTYHGGAQASNFDAPGEQMEAATLSIPHTSTSWRFLQAVEVLAPESAGTIVAFGDSITDGAHATTNANARWPDVLARRLAADKATTDLGVLNEGIGGNRILHDGTGQNALARFDRDVIGQSGVRAVIVVEGINDIGHAADPRGAANDATAETLINAMIQMARRAHAHGIKMFGGTLTPYKGAGYSSPAGEEMRIAVNDWIRTTAELDGYVDFDAATRDGTYPTGFKAADDSGDHLHPADAGYRDMGNAVNLKMLVK